MGSSASQAPPEEASMNSRALVVAALSALAAPAAAQDMIVTVDDSDGDGQWTITAELVTDFLGSDELRQVWADTRFELHGDGSNFSFVSYNPSHDTSLGSPMLQDGAVGTFVGFANGYFGTLDGSNPLWVADFLYAGDPSQLELRLVGQNSIVSTGSCGPHFCLDLYQDQLGNPGPATFEVRYLLPELCIADTNGDGELTPADFNAWVVAFNNQAPECDQNGDGACSPNDFNAWIINANAGC